MQFGIQNLVHSVKGSGEVDYGVISTCLKGSDEGWAVVSSSSQRLRRYYSSVMVDAA